MGQHAAHPRAHPAKATNVHMETNRKWSTLPRTLPCILPRSHGPVSTHAPPLIELQPCMQCPIHRFAMLKLASENEPCCNRLLSNRVLRIRWGGQKSEFTIQKHTNTAWRVRAVSGRPCNDTRGYSAFALAPCAQACVHASMRLARAPTQTAQM